jgi:hypothetical protein
MVETSLTEMTQELTDEFKCEFRSRRLAQVKGGFGPRCFVERVETFESIFDLKAGTKTSRSPAICWLMFDVYFKRSLAS